MAHDFDEERERTRQVVAQGRQVFTGKLRLAAGRWWLSDAFAADGGPVSIAYAEGEAPAMADRDDVIEVEATPVDNDVTVVLVKPSRFRFVSRAEAPS
jgi:hypothetical protein